MKIRKSGFTLVEILIVVIILGILAAIVIPQFTEASNDARESSLDSNLQTLQSQFELYKVQHLDVYPWDDGAGAIDASANIITRLTTKTDETGAAGGVLGPYMQEVPLNPFSDSTVATGPAFAAGTFLVPGADDGTVDWIIDATTGAINDGYPSH